MNGDSPKKWTEHGGGTDRDFEQLFLSPRASPGLEIVTYQLVFSERFDLIYIYIAYVWFLLQKVVFFETNC